MSAMEAFDLASPPSPARAASDVLDYYEDAGPDYAAWSTNFNMHFGLARSPFDLFRRERMLEQMSGAVLQRLDVSNAERTMVVDLGCGVGATMRWAAPRYPDTWFVGVTIVDWQVERARTVNQDHADHHRLEVHRVDYSRTGLPNGCANGCYALESACHGTGPGKVGLVREAARLLRPGAKLVVADGFRTDDGTELRGLRGVAYRALCRHWAIEELAHLETFVAELRRAGFDAVVVEDVSWRVAPSVAHVPLVTAQFLWRAFWRRERIDGWRRSNVLASLLTMLLGLCRANFSYCIVSATKAHGGVERGRPTRRG